MYEVGENVMAEKKWCDEVLNIADHIGDCWANKNPCFNCACLNIS